MTALVFTKPNIDHLKHALWHKFPEVGSAHLTEAVAAALGFNCNAGLRAKLESLADFPYFVLLSTDDLNRRLLELGYKFPKARSVTSFRCLGIPEDGSIFVNTTPRSAASVKFNSGRSRAWRNMMVAAVNAGIEQRLFSLVPGDNRWPGYSRDQHAAKHGYVYKFYFENAVPALGYVNDAGFDELSIHVALWPTKEGERWVRPIRAGFLAGEAYASSWVERRDGAWLQTYTESLYCRRNRLREIAENEQCPLGYGDREKMGAIVFG